MEDIQSLKNEKRQLEYRLDAMTITEYGSTPWAPGVTDQFESHSYSHKRYTNPTEAAKLEKRIKYLDEQIRTYGIRAQREREHQEWEREKSIPKYGYVAGGEKKETKSEALAARYDAQHRFFGMNKLKQTMARVTGQWRKFNKLWHKAADSMSREENHKIAEELNKMFR